MKFFLQKKEMYLSNENKFIYLILLKSIHIEFKELFIDIIKLFK